mgnify:CR=1 FL=1
MYGLSLKPLIERLHMRQFISICLLLVVLVVFGGCGSGHAWVSSDASWPPVWREDRALQYQSVHTTRDNYYILIDRGFHTGPNQSEINDYWNSRNDHGHRHR